MKTLQILLLTSVIVLAGCASPSSNLNRLSIGMTKKEVVAVMGSPDSTAAPGNGVEILRYELTNTSAATDLFLLGVSHGATAYRGAQEFYVRLIDGKVDSYGRVGDFDSTKDPTINVNIKNR